MSESAFPVTIGVCIVFVAGGFWGFRMGRDIERQRAVAAGVGGYVIADPKIDGSVFQYKTCK